MNVHILATARSERLLPAATLVFKTIRIGFPNFSIKVWLNENGPVLDAAITKAVPDGIEVVDCFNKKHWDWISYLLLIETEPFVICDTDMIFYESVEDMLKKPPAAIIGEHIPEHFDPVTKSIMVEKVHTCLCVLYPKLFKTLNEWYKKVMVNAPTVAKPGLDLVSPFYFYTRNRLHYSDTLALASQLLRWRSFTEEEASRYDHLHAATWVDIVESVEPDFGRRLRGLHQRAYDGDLERGQLRKIQQDYYNQMSKI